jgi:hypothetical protein
MLPLGLRKLPLEEPNNDISGHFNSAAMALCGYVKTAALKTVVENHRLSLSVRPGDCKRIVRFRNVLQKAQTESAPRLEILSKVDQKFGLVADFWKQKAAGIPQRCFLLAYYQNEIENLDAAEAILLRVIQPTQLPTGSEIISSMIEYYKDGMTSRQLRVLRSRIFFTIGD